MTMGEHLNCLHTNVCNARSKQKELGICVQLQSYHLTGVQRWMDIGSLGKAAVPAAEMGASGLAATDAEIVRLSYSHSSMLRDGWCPCKTTIVFGMSGDCRSFLMTRERQTLEVAEKMERGSS